MKIKFKNISAAALFALFFSACSTTQQASSVTKSGFLGDYSQLREGKDGQALYAYRNPRAQWRNYHELIIDPVTVYRRKNAELNDDSKDEIKALVTYFNSALHEELKKHFVITKRPGPETMRLRVALTDGDQSEVVMDTISTIMPIGLALSTVKRTVGESDTAVGFAQAEAEVIDSTTGARLAAAVDKRYGTKALSAKFDSWGHAKESMEHWAVQLSERLREWGAGAEG